MSEEPENTDGERQRTPPYNAEQAGDRAADVLATLLLVLAAVATMVFWVQSQ